MLSLIISLPLSILMIVSEYMIFQKAGQQGWKSLVPAYNNYILAVIANRKNKFIQVIIASVICFFSTAAVGFMFKSGTKDIIIDLLCLVSLGSILWGLIANISIMSGLAQSFGKSKSFVWLLLLLPIVAFPLMAFSDDFKYFSGDNNTPTDYSQNNGYMNTDYNTKDWRPNE